MNTPPQSNKQAGYANKQAGYAGSRGNLLLVELLERAGVEPLGGFEPHDVRIDRQVGCAGKQAGYASSLTDDTRCVTPGGCFVAVRGGSVDGHTLLGEAVRAGASVVVVDRDVSVPRGVVVVRVDDTRIALAKLAAAYFGLYDSDSSSLHPNKLAMPSSKLAMPVIGITGTNGKTTVGWMLRSILRAAGQSPALLGTIEHDLVGRRLDAALTTPGSLDIARFLAEARQNGATHCVLEASSHALQQRRCDGLVFAACVFTNLSGDHLDYHLTMERYAAAKRHLFDLRCPGAPGILNLDDPIGRSFAEDLGGSIVTYGLTSTAADVCATVESIDHAGSRFRLKTQSIDELICLPLVGRFNVSNALAAAATAEALGVSAAAIRAGLEGLSVVPGRLERVEPAGVAFRVIVDYAHTDEALANVLDALRPATSHRLICVFGCGGDRDRSKRPRMAAVVARMADVAWVTSDNPRREDPAAIVEEILTGFDPADSCRVEVEIDRRRAIEAAIAEARAGDTVLIAGKGHETYQLVGDKVLPFDDAAIVRASLSSARIVEEVA